MSTTLIAIFVFVGIGVILGFALKTYLEIVFYFLKMSLDDWEAWNRNNELEKEFNKILGGRMGDPFYYWKDLGPLNKFTPKQLKEMKEEELRAMLKNIHCN